MLRWNCAELSLQQPWKILSSSYGGISGILRYTGALSNLDGNLDEFRAWSPEPGSGGPLEYPTVHLPRKSHIYHPSKFQLDPTVQTPGTFRLVHHFSDLFSARERIRPEFIFFMNGISDILFEGSLYGVLCFVPKHIPLILKSFPI